MRRKATDDDPPPYRDSARYGDRAADYDRPPFARDAYASSRPAAPPVERYDDSRSRSDAWEGAGFRGHEVPAYRAPAPPVRTTLEWHASTGWRERREPEPEPYQRPVSPRRHRDDRDALPPPSLSRYAHELLPAPPPAARPRSPPPVQRDLQWERILEASQRAPLPPPPCPSWLDNSSRERTFARPAASRLSDEPTMPRNSARHGDDWFARVPEPQSAPAVPQQEPRSHVDFAEPAAAEADYVDSLDDAELEPKRQRLGWGQGLAHASNTNAADFEADEHDAAQEQRQTTPPAVVATTEAEALEQAELPSEPKAPSPQALRQPLLDAEPAVHAFEVTGASLTLKSDVLFEIDRVDADITDLEAGLRNLREADLEEDEELAEDAAARLPPPRSRPRRPLLPHVFDTPLQHSAAADAFSATPADVVLRALGTVAAAPAIELLNTDNAERAASAADVLGLSSSGAATLLPFDSAALLARNAVTYERLRDRVALHLARQSAARREAKASLALEYCQRQARWVTGLAAYTDTAVRLPVLTPADDVLELAAERAEERERTHARLPAQLPSGTSSMRVFPSRNALVQAPATAAADETRVRPWSAAERRTFLDKFSLYGKDFARIATHLAARSTADCVVYYYRTQKVDDGFGGKRKAALKKRRQYAAAAAMGFGAVAAFRDTDAGRQRERAAPTAEARQEKAALAAAARAAAVSKEKAARAGRGGGAKAKERDDAVPLTASEISRVLDALPRTGKSFRALAAATGIAVPALKAFWTAYRSTYGLEALAAQASGGATTDDRGLSSLHDPGAPDMLARSSAPEMPQAAMNLASDAPVDVQVSASADVLGAEAAGAGADERARHPLLSAVQFIRTHANAQPREDAGDQLEAAAVPGEAGAPVAEALAAVEVVGAGELAAAVPEHCVTGVDAVESDADAAENVAEDLAEDASDSGGSISAPQGADAGVATAD